MMQARLSFWLLGALALGGCDPRDCLLGIAHDDCYARGSALADFPQDDSICREYGLTPGTHDYAVCRAKKSHERTLTDRSTDYGVLEGPFLPKLTSDGPPQ